MNPRPPTPADIDHWTSEDGHAPTPVVIGGPEEGPEVIPCPTLVGVDDQFAGARVFHVPYELNEIEVAALAQGGTLWLTTYGGLPIHRVEVVVDVHNGGKPEGVPGGQ